MARSRGRFAGFFHRGPDRLLPARRLPDGRRAARPARVPGRPGPARRASRWTASTSRGAWPAPSAPTGSRSGPTPRSRKLSPPAPRRAPGGWRPGSTSRSRRCATRSSRAASPTASRAGWTAGWSAASTASRSAAPSSARACSRTTRDASKVALVHLVARLKAGGFTPARRPVPHRAPGDVRGRGDPAGRLCAAAGERRWRCAPTSADRPLRRRRRSHAGDQPGVVDRALQRVEARRVGEHPALEHLLRWRRRDSPSDASGALSITT